jgi:hypothetical protein
LKKTSTPRLPVQLATSQNRRVETESLRAMQRPATKSRSVEKIRSSTYGGFHAM